MRRTGTFRWVVIALVTLTAITGSLTGPTAVARPHRTFPAVISLPHNFQPEGISSGRGASFFVGSVATGAIYRGSYRTGKGHVLVPGTDGGSAAGTEVDRRNRLWVAGAGTGTATVYSARTGHLIRTYQLAEPVTSFINDVVVTRRAAYFTDSTAATLYVVPIGRRGHLGAARALPLTGDFTLVKGFNANGIEASPNGRTLLVIQSNTGTLYRVSARTGVARVVNLGGGSLVNGDGILRRGRTLYVVQNRNNKIAVVKLGARYRIGLVIAHLRNKHFDVPTTVAPFGSALYAVNARFLEKPSPTDTYTVVRVQRRSRMCD
jgi:sugar lactone lactonase YvrE